MEVDAISSKGKYGQRSENGGGKGKKGKNDPADICLNCGGRGHWARDCWHAKSDGSESKGKFGGKGKGKGEGKYGGTKGKGGVYKVEGGELDLHYSQDLAQRIAQMMVMDSGQTARIPPSTTSLAAASQARQISAAACFEIQDPPTQLEEQYDSSWVMTVAKQTNEIAAGVWIDVLVDSGADMHVCPVDFAADLGERPTWDPHLVTASGAPIAVVGRRRVHFLTEKYETAEVDFMACGVKRPILSVGELVRKKISVELGPSSGRLVSPSGSVQELRKIGNLYYLRVRRHMMVALIHVDAALVPASPFHSDAAAQEMVEPAGPRPMPVDVEVEDAAPQRPATLRSPGAPEKQAVGLHKCDYVFVGDGLEDQSSGLPP